ncbi:UNVERIFIED_CONTAM: hypothetical protein K2H54_028367 [Gekko kuhli]
MPECPPDFTSSLCQLDGFVNQLCLYRDLEEELAGSSSLMELAVMKQMLINLHGKPQRDTLPQKKVQSPLAKAQSNSSVNLPLEREAENVFVPKPTLFTNKAPPPWLKKVKQKKPQ